MYRALLTSLLTLLFAVPARPLLAQVAQPGPAVQGTAAYNVIYFKTGQPSDTFHNSTRRFSGRIALEVANRLYVGVSVGSWQYDLAFSSGPGLDDLDAALFTAVVYSGYAQYYPMKRSAFFLRAGAGVAAAATFLPAAGAISVERHTEPSLSGGAGIDLPLIRGGRLAATFSADYTELFGPALNHAGRAALFLGAGLTVR